MPRRRLWIQGCPDDIMPLRVWLLSVCDVVPGDVIAQMGPPSFKLSSGRLRPCEGHADVVAKLEMQVMFQ